MRAKPETSNNLVAFLQSLPKTDPVSKHYRRYIIQFLTAAKIVHPSQLTHEAIVSHLERLRIAGTKTSIIRMYGTSIRAFCCRLATQGILPTNPAIGIQLPRNPHQRPYRCLSPADYDAVLVSAREHGCWPEVALVLATGLRLREMTSLEWDHVDLARHFLCIPRRMTRKHPIPHHRQIALNAMAVSALSEQRIVAGHCRLVFPSRRTLPQGHWEYNDCPRRHDQWDAVFAPIRGISTTFVSQPGRGDYNFWHVLRETYACRAALAGVPLEEIAQHLGYVTLHRLHPLLPRPLRPMSASRAGLIITPPRPKPAEDCSGLTPETAPPSRAPASGAILYNLTDLLSKMPPDDAGRIRQQVVKFLADTGIRQAKDLTRTAVEQYLERLRVAGRSAATLLNYRSCIAQFATFLVNRGLLDEHPTKDIVLFQRRPRERFRCLSASDLEKTLEMARQHGLWPEVALAVSTGLRLCELVGLEWTHVDLPTRILLVPQWTQRNRRRARKIPLNQLACAALTEQHAITGTFRFVFPGRRTWTGGWRYEDRRREHGAWIVAFGPIRAAIPAFQHGSHPNQGRGWQLLRQTFACRAADSGVPLTSIAEWLGHGNTEQLADLLGQAYGPIGGYDGDIERLCVPLNRADCRSGEDDTERVKGDMDAQ